MPKIIENVREQLLEVAKRQTMERGYSGTTIRSVASECGLAVGTVYNYFESKDMLIASFMVEDWHRAMEATQHPEGAEAREVLLGIYSAIKSFAAEYQELFSDPEAAKVFAASSPERHILLREQLADAIIPVCEEEDVEHRRFIARFAAESLLTFTMSGESFERISSAILKVIKK